MHTAIHLGSAFMYFEGNFLVILTTAEECCQESDVGKRAVLQLVCEIQGLVVGLIRKIGVKLKRLVMKSRL